MALPSSMSANAAIDAGIYSVPRALLEGHLDTSTNGVHDETGNSFSESFNIYNFPRGSISPDDDEGIYDDPLDIVDMEIYDYPPDAAELGILDTSEYNSHRNSSVSATSSELTMSDVSAPDQLKSDAVPPVPSTSRPRLHASEQQLQDIRGSVISHESVYDHPRPLSEHFHKEHLANNEDTTPESSSMVKLPDLSLEYGQCAFKGFLYKKERFMTWIKLFCVIRNNFLECHKYHAQGNSYSPVLKLFLPRSEVVEGGGDAKRKWAFQVKHPRREGILTFASENEEEYQQWIKAFHGGASIQVQSVSTVEEMRITDLDMQKRWTTTESVVEEEIQTTADDTSSLPPRSSTFSVGSSSDDYNSDTLKRRRKFHWVKSNFMRRKSEKNMSSSQSELTSRHSVASLDVPLDRQLDPNRKSVSLEILPSAIEDQEIQEFSDGSIKGYLCIQREAADSTWVRYWCVLKNFSLSCYIAEQDPTLTLSIDLHGAKISYADSECLRSHSLKILHSDSGQCLYLASENRTNFTKWFSEITKYGREVISDDTSMASGPFVSFYELPRDNHALEKHTSNCQVSEVKSASVQNDKGKVLHSGVLMKASHTGKWKKRCCSVIENVLHVSRSFSDKVPIITLPLESCSLELLSISSSNKFPCQFKLKPFKSDKTHTFATETEPDLYVWIDAIRKASRDKSLASNVGEDDKHGHTSTLTKRKSKKLNDAELTSHISASSINSPDCAGNAFVQFGTEPWSQFWCVAYNNCLYVYETKTSLVTVKTVVLPGYKIGVRELCSTKYAHNLVLKHDGVSPIWMAFTDQESLEKWANIFYHYSRAERPQQHSFQSSTTHLNHDSVKPHQAKMSRRISKQDSYLGRGMESKDKHQKSIIHKYEKRIRKTQRVANQTELKLKKQQASLLHFKKELSRHISKLDEWSTSGNEKAKTRLKKVQMKISQIDKIVPYLEKYVAVNRQAESQTISVLKESCTMELRQLSLKYDHQTDSYQAAAPIMPSPSLQTSEPSDPSSKENPYATLSDIKKEMAESNLRVQTNYAELNFPSCQKTATRRPPSVNYVEVQLLSSSMSANRLQEDVSEDRVTSTVPQPDVNNQGTPDESVLNDHTSFINSGDDVSAGGDCHILKEDDITV